MRFIELADEIDTRMPEHVVCTVADAVNTQCKPIKRSNILMLGLAYESNVDDERESPSYVLMKLLAERGAEITYYDRYVPVIKPARDYSQFAGRKSVAWNRATIENFDLVLVATNPFVSELPRTWRVGAVQSRIRGTRWRTCPYREEKLGSVIKDTADYTDLTVFLNLGLGIL